MNNFQFYSPTEFVFGKDTENECGKYVKKYGGTKVLIHYGGGSAVKSGLIDRVSQSLEAEGIEFVLLGGVQPNPRDTKIYEGIELCRKENVDFILSVGGGSCIDSSKAIALGVPYDGDFWDFYGTGKPVEKALPIGTVLTIAAAGSEGSGATVVTKEEGMLKRDCCSDLLRSKFSILNLALTQTLPAYQTACGATDIMAHVFERYFTNTSDVEITDRLCEAVLLTMINETPKVIANPDDYQARANIMWAGTVAHNDIVGVGRDQDWNSHGIEHELSGLYDCAHGAGLAVAMPAVFTYALNHDVNRFAKIAVRVWGCQMDYDNPERTAKQGIERLRQFLISIGMPKNFEELGAKEEDIEKLADTACYGNGNTSGTIYGFITVKKEDAINIYKLML